MTDQEFNEKCRAICKVIGWPEWVVTPGMTQYLVFDECGACWAIKQYCKSVLRGAVAIKYAGNHGAACILAAHLRKKLIDAGCNISIDAHESRIVLRNTGMRFFCCDEDDALTQAAEKLWMGEAK